MTAPLDPSEGAAIRATYLVFPRWTQPLWTWWTGRALPGEQPLWRPGPWAYLGRAALAFASGMLIRSEAGELGRCLLERAADGLDERQCIALHLYYAFTEDAPAGKRQAATRAAYAEIASQLALDGVADAIRLVTTAKQRLERTVRRLREIEAVDPGEDGS